MTPGNMAPAKFGEFSASLVRLSASGTITAAAVSKPAQAPITPLPPRRRKRAAPPRMAPPRA